MVGQTAILSALIHGISESAKPSFPRQYIKQDNVLLILYDRKYA